MSLVLHIFPAALLAASVFGMAALARIQQPAVRLIVIRAKRRGG